MRTTPPRRLSAALAATLTLCADVLCLATLRLTRRLQSRSERGDVPGWVMVTLMSALLVAAVYAVAGDALVKMFNDAIKKVDGM